MADDISYEVQDNEIIQYATIDSSLTLSGVAADAKAVGDNFANLSAETLYVSDEENAQTIAEALEKMNGITGSDLPWSGETTDTIEDKLEELDGKTATDIPMSETAGSATISATILAMPDSIFDSVYPVGSIYVSVNNTGYPSRGSWTEIRINATWEQLGDGERSYEDYASGTSSGTIHFFRRTA